MAWTESHSQCNVASSCRLYVYAHSQSSGPRYGTYSTFYLSNSLDNYRLHVSGYEGSIGDSLTYHDGMEFSTHDNNNNIANTVNCAQDSRGAWWYNNNPCHKANLNGRYYSDNPITNQDGITWDGYEGNLYSYATAIMLIKK